MSEKKHFDYSPALNAPYWIQELKTTRGTVIWTFSMPMEISFFVVLIISLIVFSRLWSFLAILGTFRILVVLFMPWWIAKKYVSLKIDGKKPLQYMLDAIRYMLDFGLNDKIIYQGILVDKEDDENFVFEKMNLHP